MVSTQAKYIILMVGRNVDEKHLAFYIAFLIGIFKELNPVYFRSKDVGRKRVYPLEEMLGLHFWGELCGYESCRQKEKLFDENNEALQILISGEPKKSKINDFENQHKDLIEAFDNFIVEFCLISSLVDANEFVADGTFLDSYCNDFKALYPDEIRYIQEFLTNENKHQKDYESLYSYYLMDTDKTEEIQTVITEICDNINYFGLNLILQALENDENYQFVMNKLEHMSENITKDNVKVSIVDPDAHNMKGKDGNWGFHYNLQITTDTKNGIIVDHYVTKNPNDRNEIKKLVERLIDKFNHEGFAIGADNGYWNIKLLIEIIRGTCVELAVPDTKTAKKTKQNIIKKSKSNKRYGEYVEKKNKNKKQKTFIDTSEFPYIEEKDAFECPVMKYLLNFQRIVENKDGVEYREYSTSKCKNCPHLKKCTSQNKRKILIINEPEIQHINEFYQSERGQEIKNKRSAYAEGTFAATIEIRNFRGIKTRGEERVNLELTPMMIIHNILKIAAKMEIIVLKKVLRYIKSEKKHRRATMDMLYELQGNFIEKNGKIIDVLI